MTNVRQARRVDGVGRVGGGGGDNRGVLITEGASAFSGVLFNYETRAKIRKGRCSIVLMAFNSIFSSNGL